MAVISSTDDAKARIVDIICADAEWVRAEFEQIVSGLSAVTTATIPPHRPAGRVWRFIHLPAPVGDPWTQALPERVRAPPPDPAGSGRHC